MIRRRGAGWQAIVKVHGQHAAAKTFPTRKEALEWERRQVAALSGGVDPRAGRVLVEDLVAEWLEVRQGTVRRKTLSTDRSMRSALPVSLVRRQVGSVMAADIESVVSGWSRNLSHSTAVRYKSSLSAFFGWAVSERRRPDNPVVGVRVPLLGREAQTEIRPFSRAELDEVVAEIRDHSPTVASQVLFLALTGLRFGEARELRVRDLEELPMPRLYVGRSNPDGGEGPSGTKTGRSRRVPLSNEAMALARGFCAGKEGDELMLTTRSGAVLRAKSFKRAARWDLNSSSEKPATDLKRAGWAKKRTWKPTGRGRRLHDLRHTAATLWLSQGVPLTTVQKWLGHKYVTTTAIYSHWLGDDADRSALERLNSAAGDARVTRADAE